MNFGSSKFLVSLNFHKPNINDWLSVLVAVFGFIKYGKMPYVHTSFTVCCEEVYTFEHTLEGLSVIDGIPTVEYIAVVRLVSLGELNLILERLLDVASERPNILDYVSIFLFNRSRNKVCTAINNYVLFGDGRYISPKDLYDRVVGDGWIPLVHS